MHKFLSFFRSYIGHVGAYFMVTMLFFVLFSSLFGMEKDSIRLSLVTTSLLFAVLLGLVDFVYRVRASYAVCTVLHGVLSMIAFVLAFATASNLLESGRTLLFGTLLFAVIYILAVAVKLIYRAVHLRGEQAKEKYQNLYSPRDLDR